MPIAKVHTVGPPIKVQLPGDLTGTAASMKDTALPAVAVNDDVWVEHDEAQNKLVIIAKLGAA